jgi:lysozyme
MTILGIDISKWDGNWDAAKAKQGGATFVFIKASQATFTDPQFLANWQKAKEAGLLRGAYHYLDYTKSGIEQANYFADLLKNDPGELPPVIDYELRRTDNNPSAALGFLRDCLDQLIRRSELFADATVKRPMIYTNPGFWTEYGDQTKGDYWIQFPLWIAHWTTSSAPIVPLPWTMWQFWQFTDKGPGEAFGSESLTMDMNRFNGTLNELTEYADIGVPVVNQNEQFAALDGRVTNLEGAVAAINQSADPSSTVLTSRVDGLEGQVSNLGGSITFLSTTLGQRITAVEQAIANLGNIPPTIPVPTTPPLDIPDTTTPPSDPPETTTPPSDPPGTTTPPSDPPVPTTPPAGTATYATCTTSALNVRSGPGASYPMVAALRYGQRVKVVNRQNGWAQFEDPAGWSSEVYLSFEQTDSTAPEDNPQTPPTPVSYGICNTSGLNVRAGPGLTYPIIGGLTYGQRVKILNHSSGWAQIDTPLGWCNESYLSFA